MYYLNFQRVEQAKRLSEDKMMEQLQWYRPKPLDVTEIMDRGTNSQEKLSQVCCWVITANLSRITLSVVNCFRSGLVRMIFY